jgi:N6-L-threonylcarbamoyladenine synthase
LENTFQAASLFQARSLLICGGVARNKRLRTEFERRSRAANLGSYIPSPKLCTDNAAMVGALALARIKSGEKMKSSLDLDAYPRRAQESPLEIPSL